MSVLGDLAALLDRTFLAERCPACAGPTHRGFCSGCLAAFPRIERPCRLCGLPRPVRRCPRDGAAWPLARLVAPFEYAHPVDGFLQALKFGRGRAFGRALALPLEAVIEAGDCGVDVLVPVPLHRRRLLARGYNQATEIARVLAAGLALRLEPAAARRVRPAPPQSRLRAHARRANVAHAFAVPRALHGRRVAIVDDVITTGATVNALAAALLAAGASHVEAWAVARAVPSPAHGPRRPEATASRRQPRKT